MPDTEISVARGAQGFNIAIRVPMPDLKLALPPRVTRDSGSLLGGHQRQLRAYFSAHTRLFTRDGIAVPVMIGSIRLLHQHGVDVGDYAELEVIASARVGGTVPVLFAYDGVLHRIANHRALVRDGKGNRIGVIRYNLTKKRAAPLLLSGRTNAPIRNQ